MKILFDIISLQNYHNGGEEYVRAILHDLLKKTGIELIGVYDSNFTFLDNDYEWLSSIMKLEDIRKSNISDIVNRENIDMFFIGIGQRYASYNLEGIKCQTICVIHDIGDIEYSTNKIHYLFNKSIKSFINLVVQKWNKSFSSRIRKPYGNLIKFILKSNVEIITVSKYTANSLYYYFPQLKDKYIKIFYPPIKKYSLKQKIEDKTLSEFLEDSRPYLLFLNYNRLNKNGQIIFKVFRRLKMDNSDFRLIVTGAKHTTVKNDILYLKYVSTSDIENLYQRAWALLYPSYTEGFGYPPIEAMKYSTPVIVSNVCSMPEILGKAPLYFSPFYENELYNCIKQLIANYDMYSKKAFEKVREIEILQNYGTTELISLICQNK